MVEAKNHDVETKQKGEGEKKNPLYLSKRTNGSKRDVGGSCRFSGSGFVILIFVLHSFP